MIFFFTALITISSAGPPPNLPFARTTVPNPPSPNFLMNLKLSKDTFPSFVGSTAHRRSCCGSELLQSYCSELLQSKCSEPQQSNCSELLRSNCSELLRSNCSVLLRSNCSELLRSNCSELLRSNCSELLPSNYKFSSCTLTSKCCVSFCSTMSLLYTFLAIYSSP
jgi:hypothetical protein